MCLFSPTPTCFETPGYLTAGGRVNKRDIENRKEEEVKREADSRKICYTRTEAGRKTRNKKCILTTRDEELMEGKTARTRSKGLGAKYAVGKKRI